MVTKSCGLIKGKVEINYTDLFHLATNSGELCGPLATSLSRTSFVV